MQMTRVAAAAGQQSATTGEISSNIARISAVLYTTVNDTDATLHANGWMEKLAEELKRQIGQFRPS